MKPILLLFNISFFLAIHLHGQSLKRSELLGRPTSNSITIQLFFSDSAEVSVQYGTEKNLYTKQTAWQSFTPNEPAEIMINELITDTKYYYRVLHRLPKSETFTTRPEYTFRTQRKAGSSFNFVVQADPHLDSQSDTALYRLCLQNQLDDNPDFMIDLGDFLMTDKLKNASNTIPRDTIPFRCQLLRSYYEKIGHSVPLFIAIGNHEGESGWNLNGTPNNIAVWGTLERKKYFLNPFPNNFYTGDTTNHPYVGQRENYFAWQWGDALFMVVDPYWYTSPKPDSLNGWRWTLGLTQYNWLKKTLESSNAKYKFLFAHQIIGGDPDGRGGIEYADLYEWGGNNLNKTPGFSVNRAGWYKPIKDLLTENRVNIFFHGHDHLFCKQDKDCMVYQETPQPSHPNFSNVNYAASYGYVNGQILPQSGHLRVTVSENGIQVDYVRAYLPKNETTTRHNKDVSATYFIGAKNCYDSIITGVPVVWNSNYENEIVYPNPFSTATTIEFSLKSSKRIDLTIYDEHGRLVKKLLSESIIPKGKYKVLWDGKDYRGTEQASGIYWYSIIGTSGGKKSGKIILMR
ncbi:MAG: metallophosphoesterase [Bacteroidota bacterium]